MYGFVLYSVYVQLEVIFTQHIFKAYWAYPRDYVINKLQWIPKIWFRHHRSHILSLSVSGSEYTYMYTRCQQNIIKICYSYVNICLCLRVL